MYEFDRSTPVTVALRVHGGQVDVVAEERPSVQVDVTSMDHNDKGREAAENTRVVLEDDTLLIQVPGSEYWHWRRSPKLHVAVRVPIGSALAGKTASADVQARGVYSVVQLDVASADVQVEEVSGDAQLDAASGDLEIARVGGSLRIKSASGKINVGDVIGDVNADTASGDIAVRSAGGSLRAKTASGDIGIGALRQGQAKLSSASGDITVGVAPGTGVWLDLNTASGKSTSDLADHGSVPPGGQPASLELHARTASGDIHVYRAPSATNREAAA